MPIAAVPSYLGNDFKDASPGLRFGMYLPIWTSRADQEMEVKKRAEAKSQEGNEVRELLAQGMDHAINVLRQRERRPLPGLFEKSDFGAREAWKKIIDLRPRDKDTLSALLARQQAAFGRIPHAGLQLSAVATAPFTTGLGNEHPLENGFAFLNPYGLPYLPGSGVKGVVRRAAQELAGEIKDVTWDDDRGWKGLHNACYSIETGSGKNKTNIGLSVLDVLFGREPDKGESKHVRGALSFWDVIPQIEGNSLMVEIMTPHQSHYYQQTRERKTGNSVTPHDSGQPTPIPFLTVPPGSAFHFFVTCDEAHLARLTEHKNPGAPDLLGDDDGKPRWQRLLEAAFEHAFEWLGFGAKTAVGYGAMLSSTRRAELARAESSRREQERHANAEVWEGARIKYNRANGTLSVEKNGKTANALKPRGDELLSTLPDAVRKTILQGGFVKVTAKVADSELLAVEVKA